MNRLSVLLVSKVHSIKSFNRTRWRISTGSSFSPGKVQIWVREIGFLAWTLSTLHLYPPVMSLMEKYRSSSAYLAAEKGVQVGIRARLLTLCFLEERDIVLQMFFIHVLYVHIGITIPVFNINCVLN